MKNDERKVPQDVKTGSEIEANPPTQPGESRQKADDRTKHDADEKLRKESPNTSDENDPKTVDDMMQGKHLEKKYRGGDTTDADEFENKQ